MAPLDLDTVDHALRQRVEAFMYHEADLLDGWLLDDWLTLLEPDVRYAVPAPDCPDGDPEKDMFLVHDDRFLLEQRVRQLLGGAAAAEMPQSKTQRMITNVSAMARDDGTVAARAKFVVYRSYRDRVDSFIGAYDHILVPHGTSYRFRYRKAVLALNSLLEQGKISIIV